MKSINSARSAAIWIIVMLFSCFSSGCKEAKLKNPYRLLDSKQALRDCEAYLSSTMGDLGEGMQGILAMQADALKYLQKISDSEAKRLVDIYEFTYPDFTAARVMYNKGWPNVAKP